MDSNEQDTNAIVLGSTSNSSGAKRRRVRKRRQYSEAFKRQLVEQTLTGSESVSVVARRHDVNANQLFNWRKQYRQGLLTQGGGREQLIPVSISAPSVSGAAAEPTMTSPSRLEIRLNGGHQVVVSGSVCKEVLEVTLKTLSLC